VLYAASSGLRGCSYSPQKPTKINSAKIASATAYAAIGIQTVGAMIDGLNLSAAAIPKPSFDFAAVNQ
jgi:hypothetical protein